MSTSENVTAYGTEVSGIAHGVPPTDLCRGPGNTGAQPYRQSAGQECSRPPDNPPDPTCWPMRKAARIDGWKGQGGRRSLELLHLQHAWASLWCPRDGIFSDVPRLVLKTALMSYADSAWPQLTDRPCRYRPCRLPICGRLTVPITKVRSNLSFILCHRR